MFHEMNIVHCSEERYRKINFTSSPEDSILDCTFVIADNVGTIHQVELYETLYAKKCDSKQSC